MKKIVHQFLAKLKASDGVSVLVQRGRINADSHCVGQDHHHRARLARLARKTILKETQHQRLATEISSFESTLFFKKWTILGLFIIIFVFSNTHYNFLQPINVKNLLPVYGAGIQTHNLCNMTLLP